jgi:hypothetical protein
MKTNVNIFRIRTKYHVHVRVDMNFVFLLSSSRDIHLPITLFSSPETPSFHSPFSSLSLPPPYSNVKKGRQKRQKTQPRQQAARLEDKEREGGANQFPPSLKIFILPITLNILHSSDKQCKDRQKRQKTQPRQAGG